MPSDAFKKSPQFLDRCKKSSTSPPFPFLQGTETLQKHDWQEALRLFLPIVCIRIESRRQQYQCWIQRRRLSTMDKYKLIGRIGDRRGISSMLHKPHPVLYLKNNINPTDLNKVSCCKKQRRTPAGYLKRQAQNHKHVKKDNS